MLWYAMLGAQPVFKRCGCFALNCPLQNGHSCYNALARAVGERNISFLWSAWGHSTSNYALPSCSEGSALRRFGCTQGQVGRTQRSARNSTGHVSRVDG
jgi:hypothetical protein